METVIWENKNKYGYTTMQLKIDYDKKTYEVGSFKICADKKVTKRQINEKIEELKMLGFKKGE